MLALVPRWLPLALIALVALWLRTHDLAARVMHADEANQAVKTGELLETGYYAFDPRDHHGPTLYYAAIPIARLRGETSLATLSETSVRLVPAIAGTLGVILLGAIVYPYNRRTAGLASALMAVSPPTVYYSRYFIQETLLATFLLGAIWCTQQWWRRGTVGWAIATGTCIGLMLATKASAPLFLLAAALAWMSVHLCLRVGVSRATQLTASAAPRKWPAALSIALATAIAVAAAFYSSFGTHVSGLRDAISVYGFAADRATGASGHEKPWWYYLQLFGWQRNGGLVWQQLAFSMAALIGIVVVAARRLPWGVGAAVYAAIVFLVLSLTPYKTPWHAVHLVAPLSVLAASALAAARKLWIVLPAAAVVLWFQTEQTKLAVFLRPADNRNPYAYVHSSPDVLKLRARVETALSGSPESVVRVISEEYWPLPWYLRGLTRVGYWNEPPTDADGALVIASSTYADAVRASLHGSYRESYLGLRPGFLCVVFTREP